MADHLRYWGLVGPCSVSGGSRVQNVGGPFQIIAHGGVLFHLPGNLLAGYRFHHMSDGTIYGNNRGVDLHMLELRYAFELS